MRAPFFLGIIDVIAVPSLALFFGTRIVRLGACAAAEACHEDSKKAGNFAAGNGPFHMFFSLPKRCFLVFTLAKVLARGTRDPASPYLEALTTGLVDSTDQIRHGMPHADVAIIAPARERWPRCANRQESGSRTR